ncbi:MAG: succinate dehydrogenase cytochrome b558 subunit [Planctomycetales bacterium]|nr:succinate dehydrogenase cytochrome b558 subunit [Planctomycetales bacterium]
MDSSQQSFLARNDFLIRRLHSLSGLIPVGAYMVVHLSVNASVLNGAATFQNNVYKIHSLGKLLPFVEWGFIFLPLLFHAIVGMVIVAGALPNTHNYRYAANYRYTLQRVTGVIAFFFIMYHVFQMHGWFNLSSTWMHNVAEPLGGGQFKPYNATSTAGEALLGTGMAIGYAVGILSCVYHLANGIWTMGITWGVWTSPKGQQRASYVCLVFGVVLAVVGLSALWGVRDAVDTPEKLQAVEKEEAELLKANIATGAVVPDEHKMADPPEADAEEEASRSDDASVTTSR